ncbi:uncharacterized protein LOC114537705 [Dendronephthya gigantea]|uniref:uncharacterized protein LOC114537705 n=1 Tax=Dendronephthya gigantea TaxID=151771 RepID=UPI0010699B5B|nr:uncharacterized protein LOC114537705 [Dendronephthya gigantea]
MKTFIFVLVLFALAFADEEKRFLLDDKCNDDSDCPGQCCLERYWIGKKCHDYISEGSRCYHSSLGCGCEPGTSCQYVSGGGVLGLPSYRCVSDGGEGSGSL